MSSRTFLTLLAWFWLSTSLTAHSEYGPGVWEQMQNGSTQAIRARIESVDVSGDQAVVEYSDHSGRRTKSPLCIETQPLPSGRSEELKAMFQNQRLEQLREARRSREVVELSFQGPWQSCLTSVRLPVKGQ